MLRFDLKPVYSAPSRKQAVVLLGAGFVLSVSCCFGWSMPGEQQGILALGFLVGIILLSWGIDGLAEQYVGASAQPSVKQCLVLVGAGALLGISSCYGALNVPQNAVWALLMVGFFAGLSVLVSGLKLLDRRIRGD